MTKEEMLRKLQDFIQQQPAKRQIVQEAKEYLLDLSDEEYKNIVCNGTIEGNHSCFECFQNNWLYFKRLSFCAQADKSDYEQKRTYFTYKKWLQEEKPVILCLVQNGSDIYRFAIDCIRYNSHICWRSKVQYQEKQVKKYDEDY